MRASFARITITRLRYPLADDHGTATPDYSATPAEHSIDRCWLEPLQSQEDTDGRTGASSGYTVDAPFDVDLVSTDHVRYGGLEYRLDGDPQRVPSASGRLNSSRFTMRRWEG